MSKRIGKKGVIAIALALVAVIGVATLAVFTDRASHSMQFTTAKFSAEGYTLTRTAPVGPFCAGEDVTATLKESNTGEDAVSSVISMKATWVSPDDSLSIFGNAKAEDNAKLSIGGTNISYKVSEDKKSVTFDLPAHVLAAGAIDAARDLTLTIPEAFKSTGRIDFTFEKVVVTQDGGGFSKEFSRTELNASSKLDYSVRVGWAASSIADQNGKALMGYLTDKNSSGKYGIEFEFAFNYNTSPMKDFASKTDAKWSYYKDKADRLTFVEGMSSIGDYAFPDFELVTGLSLPESLASVGKWSFDNVSIPTLTLPAALTSFDTMSFGHINELTVITFEQAKNTSISFPTAGSTTGAFYVDPYVPTQIVGENPIAQGYDWITDQRRVAPVIRSYNYTWSGDRMSQPLDATTLTPDDNSNVDFHTAENRAKIKSVVFQDASGYYALPGMTPGDRNKVVEATANMWDVSAAQDKSVIAYLKDDGTLIIAADGVKVMANADSDWLFGDMANIETIDATLYDTSNATTLEYWHAFAEPDLKQGDGDWSGDPLPMEVPKRGAKQIVGIQNWNVSKVTSTKDMFYNANRLTSLNLGNWNTKSLKTPNGMFHGSSALTTLNVSGWNTSNVTTLQSIFSHCKALTALDVSGWDVRKVTDMSFAFSDCGAPVLDLHTWKTSSMNTLEKTFAGAAAKTVNVTGWDTSKVTTMDSAFENTTNLGALNLSSWDTSAVGRCVESDGTISGTNAFNNMFYRSGAKSINVSGFDFRSFYGKGNWNGGLYNMFRECKNLTEIIGAETWTNTGKILQLYNTFQDCEKLVTLNVSTWDTSGVTSMASAFSGCKSLTALDVSKWNVSSCETYINTFKDCASVKVLDISKWDMTKATASASQNMFNGCKSLESLTFPEAVNWLATSMAANCPKLTTIEFLSTDDSIIQRPLAGEELGAFYVAPDAGVTVPVVTKVITHGAGMAQLKNSSKYNWADDNRCFPVPTLAANSSWYKGTAAKSTITKIQIVDIYSGTDNVTESWDASAAQDGSVMAYLNGTELTIAGNGSGKINANEDSSFAFCDAGIMDDVSFDEEKDLYLALSEIEGISLLDTSRVTDMTGMFFYDVSLTSLDLSNFDTSIVTHMSYMIGECNALTNLNLSGLNTSRVTDMEEMFSYCEALTELNVSSFDTSKVEKMGWMFIGCSALTKLDLSNFVTSNVTDMEYMLDSCEALINLDLSSFDTSSVTNMDSMFSHCGALVNLNLSSFDTSKVTTASGMFNVCYKLQTVTLGKDFKFTSGTFPNHLPPQSSTNISGADGKWYDTEDGTGYTPAELAGVTRTETRTYVAVKPKIAPTLAEGDSWYKGTTAKPTITKISLVDSYTATGNETESWDASAAQDGSIMAYVNGTELTVAGNGAGKIYANKNSACAFFDSGFLTTGDLDATKTFAGVSEFNGLNLLDTSRVTNMLGMFAGCASLKNLDLSKFDTSKVADMMGMFGYCQSLTSLNVSSFDTSQVANMYGTFAYCKALTDLDVSNFNTSKVTNMSGVFGQCENLATLDISGWDTSSVTDMMGMFVDCKKLQTVKLGKDFKFVGTNGYLPEPDSSSIPGADGKWYDKKDNSAYTSAELAGVTRTETRTYMALPTLTLAPNSSWYKGNADKSSVTKISFVDSYTATGSETESWDASAAQDGSVMAYLNGTELTIAGNGSGKIYANADFSFAFCDAGIMDDDSFDEEKDLYLALSEIEGIDLLDTSRVTNMMGTFAYCLSLTSLDLSGWDTSNVTDMSIMFGICMGLTDLNLSGWDTSNVTTMEGMFIECTKLQTVTLGKDFQFVGKAASDGSDATYGYLPTPSSENIPGADGKWYDTKDFTAYTPTELVDVTRTETRTYAAKPDWPTLMLAAQDTWYKGTAEKSTITKISFVDSYTASQDSVSLPVAV